MLDYKSELVDTLIDLADLIVTENRTVVLDHS